MSERVELPMEFRLPDSAPERLRGRRGTLDHVNGRVVFAIDIPEGITEEENQYVTDFVRSVAREGGLDLTTERVRYE